MATRHPFFMVREGLLVRATGPRAWTPITKTTEEAVKAIAAAASGGAVPYVYDVDGVEARAPQFGFYQKLEQAHAAPWIHAGCRTPEDAMDTFFAGAETLTVELQHMGEEVLDELSTIADGEIHLAVTLDPKLAKPAELARLVDDYLLAGIVLMTDLDREAARAEFLARDLRALGAKPSFVGLGPLRLPPGLDAQMEHVVIRPEDAR